MKIRQKNVDIHTAFLHKFLHIPKIVILYIMSDILMRRLSYDRKARRHCNDCIVCCVADWWAVGPNMHTVGVTRTAQTPTELLVPL
jgi:hypothetical protein